MSTSAPTEMTHPNDEELAAYVDGRLNEAARSSIVEHLAACDDCYAVFQSVSEFAEQEEQEKPSGVVVRPGFGRNRVTRVAAILAVAAMALIVSMPMIRGWYAEKALFDAAASRSTRVFNARLDAEQPYQERRPTNRSGADDGDSSDEDHIVGEKAGRLIEVAEANPSASNLRRAGVASLLIRDPERAVGFLEQAREKGDDDVELWSALAASYESLAGRRGRTTDAARAVEAAERAWAMEKTPVTAWNRALALETAESPHADAAWQEYLRLDGDSPWAKEVRERFLRPE